MTEETRMTAAKAAGLCRAVERARKSMCPPAAAGAGTEEQAVRSLRGELLANLEKAAAALRSACKSGGDVRAAAQRFDPLLRAAAEPDTGRDRMKAALKDSRELLDACRKLEAQAAEDAGHRRFMREALRQARKALALGEVPVGCVIVREGRILSRGYNRRVSGRDALAHAETAAIHRACRRLGDWRLTGCTLYVTLEPCPMCAGAMVQSRVETCVIGTASDKSGSAGTVVNLLEERRFSHRVKVVRGVLEEECAEILSRFFAEMRQTGR